jgi:alpha-N-acetylglucosaminidase
MLWTKLLIGLFAASGVAQSTDGLYDLVKRRLPNHVDDFRFSLVSNITEGNGGYDQFMVQEAPNGKVLVQGTSLSALSSGYAVKV